MFKYCGMKDGLHLVKDLDDGVVDSVTDDELRDALLKFGSNLQGLYWTEDGGVVDDFGVVCVKAPPPAREKQQSK